MFKTKQEKKYKSKKNEVGKKTMAELQSGPKLKTSAVFPRESK